MRKDFIVNRQGKDFILYLGLLDMGHQNGLKSIRTEIIQIPIRAIESLCRKTGTPPSLLAMEMFSLSNLENLTARQGEDMIRKLNERPAPVSAPVARAENRDC